MANMMETGRLASVDVIDLRDLFRAWIKWAWLIVLAGIIGAAWGVSVVRGLTPVYQAKMTVQPDTGGNSNSQGGGVGQLLTGFSLVLGQAQASTFDRLQVVTGSLQLATRLQEQERLLQRIYSGLWDNETNNWRRPSDEKFLRNERIRAFLGQQGWKEPSIETLANYLSSSVRFQKKKETPFYEVTVSHPDRAFAFHLLTLVYFGADELLREQDLEESRRRLSYVESQLRSASNVDTRQALSSLLLSEQRRAMLLKSDLPYAAKILSPAFASESALAPNLLLAIGGRAAVAMLAAFTLVTLLVLFRRESKHRL